MSNRRSPAPSTRGPNRLDAVLGKHADPSRASKIDYEIADQTSRRTRFRLCAPCSLDDKHKRPAPSTPRWSTGSPAAARPMRFRLARGASDQPTIGSALPTAASRGVARYPNEQPVRCQPGPETRPVSDEVVTRRGRSGLRITAPCTKTGHADGSRGVTASGRIRSRATLEAWRDGIRSALLTATART